MRNAITGVLAAVLALTAVAGAGAQEEPVDPATASVDVTVWRRVSDPSLLYVSTRPEGGRWRTLNTALDMSARSESGNFHQSNAVRVRVPLADGGSVNVDVTVWRRVSDPSLLYVSTRPEGGSWRTENTALDMSARSESGNFHQSNAVRVEVQLQARPVAHDRSVLIALYDATNGDRWHRNDNWLSNAPLNDWYGVTASSDGRVTELDLEYNSLVGEVPSEIGGLSGLKVLDLTSGSRRSCAFFGIGCSTSYAHANRLTGRVPPELGNLTNLESLSLAGNELSGEIPPQLGNLTNLERLSLGVNELSGEIPPQLGNLTNLESLHLGDNELSGAIPPELGNLSRLESLFLQGNEWSGELPPGLGNLSNLESLYLGDNKLTGCVPDTLLGVEGSGWPPLCADATGLIALYNATGGRNWQSGSRGWLRGPVREWHGVEVDSNNRVIGLDLSENSLEGMLPPELTSLSRLESLDLSDNELSGEIPPGLGNLSRLQSLHLSRNQLRGEIPPELGGLSRLRLLFLTGNELSGEIPPELGNLSSLRSLLLSGNELSGTIPPQLGNLSGLGSLYLGGNQLSGAIPPELGNLPRVETIDLSSNQLSGLIPQEFGNLRDLYALELDGNQLSGEIPAELGNLVKLHRLYINDNQLTGEIPDAFGSLPNLEYFRLTNNQITGCVPVGPSLRFGERYFGDLQPCPTSE